MEAQIKKCVSDLHKEAPSLKQGFFELQTVGLKNSVLSFDKKEG